MTKSNFAENSIPGTMCMPYGLYSLPDSSVHGILQERILELVAMPSSKGSSQPRDQTHICYVSCIGEKKVKVKSLSRVQLFATPWTVTYQAKWSMGFSRQEYWSWLTFPSPGDLPNQGLNPGLLHCRQTLYHLTY